jgi:hypothetical protein
MSSSKNQEMLQVQRIAFTETTQVHKLLKSNEPVALHRCKCIQVQHESNMLVTNEVSKVDLEVKYKKKKNQHCSTQT